MSTFKSAENLLTLIRDGINRLVNGKQFISHTSHSLTGVVTFIPADKIPTGATEAWVYVEANFAATTDTAIPFKACVRYSIDSAITPLAGIDGTGAGMPHWAGPTPLILRGNDVIRNFRAVRTDGTVFSNVTLKIIFYR